MTFQDVSDLNWHNVEDDTCIVLHVKHACELIFQPSIVVKCIYTDVPTILFFSIQITRKGLIVLRRRFCCCWSVVDSCSHCSVLCLFHVLMHIVSFLVLQSSWWGRESWLLYFVCLPDVLWFYVALPQSAVSCSSVSDCGLSTHTYFFHTHLLFNEFSKIVG